ncbi:MAG: hypothetical protein J6K92_03790 [Oscillospiraceae bacterium]|nr:hypothetical protein [Oscillospiraceae bacterium]
MDMLCSAAASACLLGIIFSVINGMNPSEKLSRQMNIIFSLIMIAVVIAPFAKKDFTVEFENISGTAPEDKSYIFDNHLDDMISSNISENLGKALADRGIFPIKISVDINNSSDDSISITRAEIILMDSSLSDAAAETAADILGVEKSLITVKAEENDNADN